MIRQKVCECEEPVRPEETTDQSPFFFCRRCSRIRKQVVLCLCGCNEPVEFPVSRVPGHGALLPELGSFFPPALPPGKRKTCTCEKPEPLRLVQKGDHFFKCRICEGICEIQVLCSCGCGKPVMPPDTEFEGHGSRRRKQIVLSEARESRRLQEAQKNLKDF